MNVNYFKTLWKSSLMVLFLCLGLSSWGQYVVDFDGQNDGTHATTYGFENHNLNGITWSGVQVIIPTSTLSADWYNGTRSLRLRGYGTSYFEMTQNKLGGIGDVTFNYRQYGTDTQQSWKVEYSTDDGSTWVQLGNNFTATAVVQTFNETLNEENARIRIVCNGTGSSNRRMNIDDLVLTDNVETTNPTFSVTPSVITNLNYALNNGPSASQSFVLSGENLDGSEDVTLLADTGFEISLDDTLFDDELTLTAYDGANTTVYVRMASGLAVGVHSGIVFIDGYGVEEEVTVSGTVLSLPVVTGDIFTGTVGVAFSEQIIATENPTSYAILSGTLPNGLTFNTETGLISGTPTVAGNEFEIEVTATNAAGTSAADSFLFDIEKGIQTVTGLTDINAYFGDADITLPAITEQGISIEYISNNESVATVSGNILSIVGLGTTTILAGNDGDANYTSFTDDFTITVTEAPEEYAGVGTFEKITSVEDLTDGYYVIIDALNNANAMTNSHSGVFLAREAITPTGNTVENPHTGIVWYIETNGDGRTIYNEVTEKYVSYTGSSNNIQVVDAVATNNQRWAITYSDEEFHFNNVSLTTRKLQYNSNSGQERFAAYTGSQKNLLLYKLQSSSATEVTWTIGNVWSNVTGPTINDDVVIEGDLTLAENVSALTLTVASGGKITVPADMVLTVDGKITNNGDFTVENDGILYQNNFTGANEGAITVERNSNPMFRLDYTLWSSPVSGMRLVDFSEVSATTPTHGTGTLWTRVYTLGATIWEQVWATQPDFDNDPLTFTAAKGYLYRAPNDWVVREGENEADPYEGAFIGVPNNGPQSISILNENNFEAIGNPYPSPINADTFLGENLGTLYFWTNTNPPENNSYDGINNWVYYNVAGKTGVDGEFEVVDNMPIQPGQGFVIMTEQPTVVFNNSMRTSNNGDFYKMMSNEKHRFWLNLSNEEVVFNQILVGYIEDATSGVDTGIDAKMFAYEGNALYSTIENSEENYVIQGRSLPFTASDVVALGFRAVNAGSFTISLSNFDGLFAANQNIYLKDNFTQAVHNLKDGAYSFVSEEGVFNTRFEVVYQTAMSVENPVANNSNWVVYKQENGFQIQSQGFDMNAVQVFDMLGRMVYTSQAEGTTHHIPVLGADGVYIVKVTTTDNVVLSKKVR